MSEMIWVQRNDTGAICATFANQQPGYADEQLPADHPEVVEFLNQPPPASGTAPQNELLYDHENRLRALEGQPPLSMADFITANDPTARSPPS